MLKEVRSEATLVAFILLASLRLALRPTVAETMNAKLRGKSLRIS
jgi:hypothetical protein